MRKSLRLLLPAAALVLLAIFLSACSKPQPDTQVDTQAALATVMVYKSPTCGCCSQWEAHLREHGFNVETTETTDVMPIKEKFGVPGSLSSCHTAVVDGYALEGHVPADVIKARYDMQKDLEKLTSIAEDAASRLRESKKIVEDFEKDLKESKRTDLKEAKDKTKAMKDSIEAVLDYMFGKEDERQGITRSPDPTPLTYIYIASSYVGSSRDPISDTDRRVYKHADDKITEMVKKVNEFFTTQWSAYRSTMEKVTLSPFKDFEPLKKE